MMASLERPDSFARPFDFWDGQYEGRRLFSELLGTFFLVFVAAGGAMVNALISVILGAASGARTQDEGGA